ncbi:uncharacterized protein TRAVEDRAFT_70525 [Trametes versicolor FP-101664 SS1]|uniref:uncharacterized protein n=1 Tax=Trametes versicolor (strain FP-101664) TaxID=717944 RepID=UPI0004623C58|nr:uncharacterized protein TRAVEDRAFT_70525 [Trametes versicolor FP-101664 SS1]EIW60024.1 hypothetical protein TRAVEDRAFT_70525 [Trametes versicolor FP-101664 SS1]
MSSVQSVASYFAYSVRWDTSLTLSALTILYYDYAMTIFSEIEYYWIPAKHSLSFFLFVTNRYIGILGPIPVFFEYFSAVSEHRSVSNRHCADISTRSRSDVIPLDRCRQLQLYHQIFAMLSQAVVAILLILRTYALYNCSKRMLALLISMHLGGAVHCLIRPSARRALHRELTRRLKSAVLTSKSPLTTDTPLGFRYSLCNLSLTDDQGVHLALAWSAMLWFDTIIFLLTLYKAVLMRRELSGGLLEVLFRDGTIYYGILVVVNMINIITFLKTAPNTPLKGMATTMTNVLSVTLTSRLMLNLRDPSLQRRNEHHAGTSRFRGWSTGQFTSRVMSFRYPTGMDPESVTLDDFGTSCTSEGANSGK